LRWYQIPLSSTRIPRSVIFSYVFQAGLQRYQQLRALKHLRVGRPIAPPPPGLLEHCPPAPSPADIPPRVSSRPRDASRGRDTASLGGDANRGQHTAARTVPQQASRSPGGDLLGTARGQVSTDSEDNDHIPVKGTLLAGDEPPSPADHQQATCPWPDPLANSLESLVQEKREQSQAGMLQAGLVCVQEDDDSPCESLEKDMELSEDNRAFLTRYAMTPRFIPAIHPGEPVFCAHLAPVPTLDSHRLKPQSTLEGFFLSNSPACQAAFIRNRGLSLFYRCAPTCPLPVLRWLFQLMTLCPDITKASQALWEIWLSTGGEPWCPTVQEIGEAFTHLGADLSPLRRQRLLPPELCPTDRRSLDPSFSPTATLSATNILALVTQLGDICKFLALCVVTQPCCYPDGARLALVTLFCFLGLDRALRCQPLPELQHLLHCLLEGIQDWQGQGALPVSEPSRHGPAAGEAARHRATSWGTGRDGGAGPAAGAGTASHPA
ncbi:F178B protein, partial [Jacana jacana]|nr:F178B protein [Jacana jacana]